jgi:hypothetical protein
MRRKVGLLLMGLFLLLSAASALADEITLMAVGDILPHPSWQKFEIPVGVLMKDVIDKFFEADIVIGNLETPLTGKSEPTPSKLEESIKNKKEFVFKSEGADTAQGLKDAGFTVLTLANNHMMDYREEGLMDTLDVLGKAGIATAGAGLDLPGASRPAVLEIKDRKVVVISASDVVPLYYEAADIKPGIASMKDAGALIKQVQAVREEDADAIIVLSLHWGVEAALAPTARQKDLSHKLIDAGADLILGHHPHRIQGVEIYKGRPVFYSLGNFQFDSNPPGDESVIARVVFKYGREPADVSVMPVLIEKGGFPRPLKKDEPEYAAILKKIDDYGRPLGTMLKGKDVVALPPPETKKDYLGSK